MDLRKGTALPSTDQARIGKLVEQLGERPTSKLLGISPHTLARAVAGFRLHGSTAEYVLMKLEQRKKGK